MTMGDKANTKHGNMVALPYFSAQVTTANLTNSPYQLHVVPSEVTSGDFTPIALPFAGSVVALTHGGDYAGAGTWTMALKLNGTVYESTRTAITADGVSWTANSPHGITFAAGDTLGIVFSTSSDYSSNDSGVAYVVPYVIFANV